MTGEWTNTTWGTLVVLEYGKALRDYRAAGGDVPVFGTNGAIGFTDKPLSDRDGIVIGRKGAYRGVHYSPVPFFVIDTAFYLRPKVDLDMRWAYYQLLTADINGMDSGSAIPSTSREDFYKLPISVPSVGEQRNIAAMLSQFDERIALLRETNVTLEAIAQALFKSWFVDFDPVRAKSEGRAPEGMDEATAALFPDSFEVSPLGPIPTGWETQTLAQGYELNPTRKLAKGSDAMYLDMASAQTLGFGIGLIAPRPFGSGSKFIEGDTLLARITPCLENGKTSYVDFLPPGEVGWGSTEFVVLRPRPPLPPFHAYLLSRHEPFRAHAIRSMSGTSGRQRIQNDSLGTYKLAVPTAEVAEAFGGFIEPLRASMSHNYRRMRNLAEGRDELLPRLISGRLRIADAQRTADEVLADTGAS